MSTVLDKMGIGFHTCLCDEKLVGIFLAFARWFSIEIEFGEFSNWT